jgi:hypothetical protein
VARRASRGAFPAPRTLRSSVKTSEFMLPLCLGSKGGGTVALRNQGVCLGPD